MAHVNPFYFVAVSRRDHARVQPILEAMQRDGIEFWLYNMLSPGEVWQERIEEALHKSHGVIVFITHNTLQSPVISAQMNAIKEGQHQYLVGVGLDPGIRLPAPFDALPLVDVSQKDPQQAAARIWQALDSLPPLAQNQAALDQAQITRLSTVIAEGVRSPFRGLADQRKRDSVFIVHGHDLPLRDEVEAYLKSLGINSVILSELDGGQTSLFQKFLNFSEDVEFAVVLLTADDYGASRRQYDVPTVGEKALQFRARQNVILELGFFYGFLGWENVFVLFKPAAEVFPNFEVPSDLGGILFDEVDADGKWKAKLWARLAEAGFEHPDVAGKD
jgi:predicted nucleotide-binding protein